MGLLGPIGAILLMPPELCSHEKKKTYNSGKAKCQLQSVLPFLLAFVPKLTLPHPGPTPQSPSPHPCKQALKVFVVGTEKYLFTYASS